jgi:hypothetical protein
MLLPRTASAASATASHRLCDAVLRPQRGDVGLIPLPCRDGWPSAMRSVRTSDPSGQDESSMLAHLAVGRQGSGSIAVAGRPLVFSPCK